MHLAAVGEKVQISIKLASDAIRLGDTQPEAVVVQWTCGDVPEFTERL